VRARLASYAVLSVAVSIALGRAVAAQAKSPCTSQLRDFVRSEAVYSGFTRLELIRQLRIIRRNDFDVHDAEQILPIAEDVARGTRLPLARVVRAILRAVNPGDASEVVEIDPRTSAIVRRHGRLGELLTTLAGDFKNSIHDQDADVAAGRLAVRVESNEYLSEVSAACAMGSTIR
jgi:hypothetical protein